MGKEESCSGGHINPAVKGETLSLCALLGSDWLHLQI